MTKIVSSKYKIDRRYGINLWGDKKSSFNKRKNPPGQHGNARKRFSNYGMQLAERQKLRKYYGRITEKQFRSIYKEAARIKGDKGSNLIGLLESRLDTVVYRLKIAPSMFSARQMVSHGYFMVNNKKVDIPSYRLKENDRITLINKYKKLGTILKSVTNSEREVPPYLDMNMNTLTGCFLHKPEADVVPYPIKIETGLVIEWYSRRT